MNPNDKTADIYDLYISPLKGPEVTAAELKLIQSLIPPTSHILDIGGGTGRHAIPLAQAGHSLTVIDTSEPMLAQVRQKSSASVETIHADILTHPLHSSEYDLIILMWNAFNEIALTEEDGLRLLRTCSQALAAGGKILINIDDPHNFEPAKLQFTTESTHDGIVYHQDWHVASFDPRTNTTTSEETITVLKNNEVQRREVSEITQRWWTQSQITKMANAAGLAVKQLSLPINAELYLVLSFD